MRVVGGELRGRRLGSPPRRSTELRPTSDRAREALFSILGDVGDLSVLDLFCGTGALGIEAVSRGARSAVLVDSKPALARRNVAELGLGDRCKVVRADALRYLSGSRDRFELAFCDPPYALAGSIASDLERLVLPRIAKGGRLVVESPAREPVELTLPLVAERRFGEALLRIHGLE